MPQGVKVRILLRVLMRYNQAERTEQRKQHWQELTELSKLEDIRPFYSKYVKYLEWEGVISKYRQVLLNMARKVANSERTG